MPMERMSMRRAPGGAFCFAFEAVSFDALWPWHGGVLELSGVFGG